MFFPKLICFFLLSVICVLAVCLLCVSTCRVTYKKRFKMDLKIFIICTLRFLFFTDFFNELLKSRKKISDAFKAGKSKTKINDFELSDDEGKNGRRKKVSFLKTSKNDSPLEDTASEPHEHEPTDSSIYSFASKYSTNTKEDDKQFQNSGVEFSSPQTTRHSLSKSLLNQTSDDAVLDLPSPLLSDSSVAESQRQSVSESRGKERKDSDHEESSQMILAADLKHVSSAGVFTVLTL